MTRIELRESISDGESAFNMKRLRISDLSLEGPIRTVDSKHTNRRSLERVVRELGPVLVETSKTLAVDAVRSVLASRDPDALKRHFGYAKWHSDYPNAVNLTFKFNPLAEFGDPDRMSGYLDHYYQYSGTVLMVPNVNVSRNVYAQGRRVGVHPIIGAEDFRRYVTEAHRLLDYRNNKPIFVPLNLDFGIRETEELADLFLREGYTNVWVDMEAGSTADKRRAALLRAFVRRFDEAERFDELVVYMTNIKREILAHPKDAQSPSSDVLAAVMGANIIGVNRSPPVMIPEGAPPLPSPPAGEMLAHKARLLDPSSYYYTRLDSLEMDEARRGRLYNKKENILANTVLLNQELREQTRRFLEEMTVRPYVSGKAMVREFHGGELVDHLFAGRAGSPAGAWF